jgi:hypothetical protein
MDSAIGVATTGIAAAAGSGTAGKAANTAPHRNFHRDDELVAGAENSTIFTTARYKNINTQHQLRGEHTPIESGPNAECYECGRIFVEGDNRPSWSVLLEDTKELIVSTNSYIKEDWSCISCKKSHPLLPLTSRKHDWSGGRKLIFLSDHNMPAILPSKDDLFPIIMKDDGGLLREIGTTFLAQLSKYTIPEGSAIFIGSVTHLMEEGRVGYAKGLVTEYQCCGSGSGIRDWVLFDPWIRDPE